MRKILVAESIHPDGLASLKRLFEVEVCLESPRATLLEKIAKASAIVVRSVTQVDRELIDSACHLQVIARAGTGVDNIDIAYAQQRGVDVVTVPDGNSVSAAEFTLMQILALCRNAYPVAQAVEQNDFRREAYQGIELAAQTVSLIGVGRIGQLVAQRLGPFGCRLIGYDIDQRLKPRFAELGIAWADSLDAALRACDILTIHLPRTPQTQGMINLERLRLMKTGVRIVNTSRGGIIVEADLLAAVKSGHVAAAAIDVLEQEPPFHLPPEQVVYSNPLLRQPRITITPHIAASTEEAQKRIALRLAELITAKLQASQSSGVPVR